MKNYFKIIKYSQEILLGIAIAILMVLPLVLVFNPSFFTDANTQVLYSVSHYTLFFVMMIRPLADIFSKTKWIRPLVILRKGMGVLSASIIVSFILSKLIIDPTSYIASFSTLSYWSLSGFALFAHLADISAVLLLITSNNLSKRILGEGWKKVQKLSYVYFYGSALYVYLVLGNTHMLYAMIIVTIATYSAFIKNKKKRLLASKNI